MKLSPLFVILIGYFEWSEYWWVLSMMGSDGVKWILMVCDILEISVSFGWFSGQGYYSVNYQFIY